MYFTGVQVTNSSLMVLNSRNGALEDRRTLKQLASDKSLPHHGSKATFDINYEFYTTCEVYAAQVSADLPRTYDITKMRGSKHPLLPFPSFDLFLVNVADEIKVGTDPNQWKLGAACSRGQISNLDVGSKMRNCGMVAMISFLCMTDHNVMRDSEATNKCLNYVTKFKGFQLGAEDAYIPHADLRMTQAIRSQLESRYCNKLFYVNVDELIKTVEPETIKDIFWAALDAAFYWTIVIEYTKYGVTPNMVQAHTTHNLIDRMMGLSPDEMHIFSHFPTKILFCQQYSLRQQTIQFGANNNPFVITLTINNVRYKYSCDNFDEDIFVMKTTIKGNRLLRGNRFLAKFAAGGGITEHNSEVAVNCRPDIPEEFWNSRETSTGKSCGLATTLRYICLTDPDTDTLAGYNLDEDPNFPSDPNQPKSALKIRFQGLCTKIFRKNLLFGNTGSPSPYERVSEHLGMLLDAGYDQMLLIYSGTYLSDPEMEKLYSVHNLLISIMDDHTTVNRYRGMVAYFCKK